MSCFCMTEPRVWGKVLALVMAHCNTGIIVIFKYRKSDVVIVKVILFGFGLKINFKSYSWVGVELD